jgi:hypothetical protein
MNNSFLASAYPDINGKHIFKLKSGLGIQNLISGNFRLWIQQCCRSGLGRAMLICKVWVRTQVQAIDSLFRLFLVYLKTLIIKSTAFVHSTETWCQKSLSDFSFENFRFGRRGKAESLPRSILLAKHSDRKQSIAQPSPGRIVLLAAYAVAPIERCRRIQISGPRYVTPKQLSAELLQPDI